MSDLGVKRDALLRAGRQALRPTEADRERVLRALQSKLGPAVVLTHPGAPPAPQVGPTAPSPGAQALQSTLLRYSVFGLVALGLGTLTYARLQGRSPTESAAPIAAAAPGSPADLDATDAGIPEPLAAIASANPSPTPRNDAATAVPSAVAVSTPPRRPGDNLSREVAILSRAEGYLHGGQADRALRELDEHERRFSEGLLTEERLAARIQALCALGRHPEAMAQLARLERMSPRSPHTDRARQACRSSR